MCLVQTYTARSKSKERVHLASADASQIEAVNRTADAQDVRRNLLENSEEFDARVCSTSPQQTYNITACFDIEHLVVDS